MSETAGAGTPDCNWEQRQKHTSFFQTQVGSAQQAATASQTTATLLLTLGLALPKFSGFAPGQDWLVIFAAVAAWALVGGMLAASFSRAARRIRDSYLVEHATLFPGAIPYRLESYLLDFADRFPWLVGRSSNQ